MKQLRNASAGRAATGPRRPLSARSVMASLLLGRRPARARGRDLVRWAGMFGIASGTARVALHRMTAAGELTRDGDRYELVGALARRQEEQESALAPSVRRWDGDWRMAVSVGDARTASVRAEMRAAFRRARLGEWREGVWLRPDNLVLVEDPRAAWLDARPDDDAAELAAHLFAPAAWAAQARALVEELATETHLLEQIGTDALAPAFLAGAAALRHVRADPLLPVALVPAPWPGDELRARYAEYERTFTAVAREWFREQ